MVNFGVSLVPPAGEGGGSAPGGGANWLVPLSDGNSLGPTTAPPITSAAAPTSTPDATRVVRICDHGGRGGLLAGTSAAPSAPFRGGVCSCRRWLAGGVNDAGRAVWDAEVGSSLAGSGPVRRAGCGLRWYSAISAIAESGR